MIVVNDTVKAALADAALDQTFEFPSLLPGISDEKVVAICTNVQDGTRHFEFHWHGVFVARGRAFVADGLPRTTILD